MPSEESVTGVQRQLLEQGWTPNSVRKIAHTVPIGWRQALDYGVIGVNDLSPEQLAQYQREQEAAVARAADRELRRRACLAEHGEHGWWLTVWNGAVTSISCQWCGVDWGNYGQEEGVCATFPVRMVKDRDTLTDVAQLRVP